MTNILLYCLYNYLDDTDRTWIHSYQNIYCICKSSFARKYQKSRGSLSIQNIDQIKSYKKTNKIKNICITGCFTTQVLYTKPDHITIEYYRFKNDNEDILYIVKYNIDGLGIYDTSIYKVNGKIIINTINNN